MQQQPPTTCAPFSVLICTKNRGDSLIPTVRSILAADTRCDELLILDQSPGYATQEALVPFRDDPRLRYVRTDTQGKGLSLNEGLRLVKHDIVAITDDDCEVLEDWPIQQVQAFARDEKLAITYGNVLPVDHDPLQGFIPTYYVNQDRFVTNIWQKLSARGIGANTVVHRKHILALGGFDPELCPGGTFKACVDRDMTIRCVLAGYHVYESRDSRVYHYGFRNWDDGRKLACNAFYGIGAAHIKPLKCGKMGALVLLLWELGAYAVAPTLWSAMSLRRPFGLNRVLYFFRGMYDGWKLPVDKQYMIYQGQAAASQTTAPGDSTPLAVG